MDFGWSAEDQQRHDAARSLGRSLCDDVEARDRTATFSRAAWDAMAAGGLLGLPVASTHGGEGLSLVETVYAHEGFARGCEDAGLMLAAHAHLFGCLPILRGASPEQQAALIPELATGRRLFALAITEAGAGSDAFAMATTATRDGDDYVLTGEKVWVSNGPIADHLLVFARTGDGPKFASLSCFRIDRGTPGLTQHPNTPRLGLRTCAVGPLTLSEVRVPAHHRIGAEGAGAQLFLAAMEWERIGIMTAALGSMDRLLTRCLRHVRKPRGGRPALRTHQAVTHRLADLRAELERSRMVLYRAAWLVSEGKRAPGDAALSKLTASEAHVQAALTALRTFGAAGLVEGAGIERALRDATCGLVYSGTSDIQRNLIARMMGA